MKYSSGLTSFLFMLLVSNPVLAGLPGINTPDGSTDLSLAVQGTVGIDVNANGGLPGTVPDTTVKGALTVNKIATANQIVISDQAETVGSSCTTLGTLAETNTGMLLSCQSSGNQLIWLSAQGGGGCSYSTLPNMGGYYISGAFPGSMGLLDPNTGGSVSGVSVTVPNGSVVTSLASSAVLGSSGACSNSGGNGPVTLTPYAICNNGQWLMGSETAIVGPCQVNPGNG